jgi:hypothetical protein
MAALMAGDTNSPELPVLTATLIAVIWYTRFTFESLEYARDRDAADRTRARDSLATGLLSELRWLQGQLRQITEKGMPAYDPLDHPVLRIALSNLTLFPPTTAEHIAEYHYFLQTMSEKTDRFHAERVHDPHALSAFAHSIQTDPVIALNELRPLVHALKASDGVIEKRRRYPQLPMQPPDLDPIALERIE